MIGKSEKMASVADITGAPVARENIGTVQLQDPL